MPPWYSKLDPTPSFPDYTGPYSVGTHDVEIAAHAVPSTVQQPDPNISTLAFRVFYPCKTPDSSKYSPTSVNWISEPQRGILSGYARFLGASPAFANLSTCLPTLLSYVKIPAHKNAPLTDSPTSQRWPVLVFSHGLGGSRNAYSQLCGSLASHGIVVFAPDHRDGSQPVAYMRVTDKSEAKSVEYRRYPHKPSPEVFEGRDEQLRIRLWEVSAIVEAISMINAGDQLKNLNVPKKSKAKHTVANPLQLLQGKLEIQEPGSIAFAGHSFGAATVVQLVKSAFYHGQVSTPLFKPTGTTSSHGQTSAKILSQITPTTPTLLLDLWALPISSPATSELAAKPMPCFHSPVAPGGESLLAVLSDAFLKWESNYRGVKEALVDPQSGNTDRPSAHVFYPLQSAHLSQSDFGVLFPNLTKYLARAIEPARTIELNVRAMLEVMRRGGMSVEPPRLTGEDALEKALEDSVADDSIMVSADADSGVDVGNDVVPMLKKSRGDHLILSRKPGTVRGWVFIQVNADSKDVAEAARAAGESAEGTQQVESTTNTGTTRDITDMSGAQAERDADRAGKNGIVHDRR